MEDFHSQQFKVRHGEYERGPLNFRDIEFMIKMKEIPKDAEYKPVYGGEWEPLSKLLKIASEEPDEVSGLIPKLSDAILYLGIFVFFVGAVLTFAVNAVLGVLILIISLALEGFAVYRSFTKEKKAITKNIGNFMAIGWIVFQLLLTIGIVGIVLSQ